MPDHYLTSGRRGRSTDEPIKVALRRVTWPPVHYGGRLGYVLKGQTPDLLGPDVMRVFNTLDCSLPTQFLL